ncbi:MAG: DUF4339 domain-containing protein [Planctomycetaceae bacterium]
MGLGLGMAMAGRMMQPGIFPPTATPPGLPPTLPSAWHVAVNGQGQGPYSPDQVASGIAAGQITKSTLVWAAGMAGWVAAGQVPQLASAFGPPHLHLSRRHSHNG